MQTRIIIPLVLIGLFSVGTAYAMTNTQAKQLEIAAYKGNTTDLAKLETAAKSGDAVAQAWYGGWKVEAGKNVQNIHGKSPHIRLQVRTQVIRVTQQAGQVLGK